MQHMHRKSRRQFQHPILPMDAWTPVAGKEVGPFRRVARGHFPPEVCLSGRQWHDGPWARSGRLMPVPPPFTLHSGQAPGYYRVADTTLEGYELYIGEDAEPNLAGSPDATSATLPFSHTITPPVAGQTDFRSVVRYRNRYNLVSQNQYSRSIVVDSGGDQVTAAPSSASDVQLRDGRGLRVIVEAVYMPDADGSDAADTWVIYYTDTGADPVPGVDSPVTETMRGVTGVAGPELRLLYNLGPFSAAADVRVIVRVKRSSDDEDDGSTSVVQHTVASLPVIPGGALFGGAQYRQM